MGFHARGSVGESVHARACAQQLQASFALEGAAAVFCITKKPLSIADQAPENNCCVLSKPPPPKLNQQRNVN